jgi:hypothetical protein
MSELVEKYKFVQFQGLSVFKPSGRPHLPSKRSAGELWGLACSGCAPIVGAAHNKSFERTRTGILQSGIISFLPNCSLPVLAAQLQRYAPA